MSNQMDNKRIRHICRRFRDAHDGAAAVEFAMVLPFLVLAYAGMVDVVQLVMANRKVTQLTSTLSDLTARLQTAPVSEINNIFGAASTVLLPYDASKASMVISSIVVDSAGVGKVCWSSSYPAGTAAPARGTTVTLPDSAKVPKTSVIMASANYQFTPILGQVIVGTVTLGDNPIFTRPRNGKADGTDSIEQIVRSDVKGCPTY
ncbi:TadE/TadG family type IV pilus assembly protein [Bosea thiooxidans]